MASWGRSYDEERDADVAGELEPRSRQARRGLVTRGMLGTLRFIIANAYGDDEVEEYGEDEGVELGEQGAGS
jgi:hypothetical protein